MFMQKLDKAHELMESSGVDAMVITSPINFCYVSGMYESTVWMLMNDALLNNCVVVPKGGEPILIISTALVERVKRDSSISDAKTLPTGAWIVRSKSNPHIGDTWAQGVAEVLKENGLESGRIGVEMKYMRMAEFKLLGSLLKDATFCDIGNILSRLRSIKTPEEILKLRKASAITEAAIKESFDFLREGIEDFEVLKRLKMVVNDLGGGISHANWGIGPRSGEMFSSAFGHKATLGDVVRFDIGVQYQGYRSDISRTGVIGEPSDRVRNIYESLLKGQRAAIERIKPGEKLSSVYWEAIDAVRRAGYQEYVRHMIGHSVGFNCEEEPFICAESAHVFEPNMVFSVELSWYEPGLGGIVVEDMILVTEDGYEEISSMDHSLYCCSL